jgi:hypothetical protein
MGDINTVEKLQEEILLLENRQAHELQELKEHLHLVHESLKPSAMVKNLFSEVTESPDIRGNLLNTAIGVTTGYLASKVLVGSTHNPIKKLMGTVLQFAISNLVSHHTDGIKSIGMNLIKKIFSKK